MSSGTQQSMQLRICGVGSLRGGEGVTCRKHLDVGRAIHWMGECAIEESEFSPEGMENGG